MRLDTRECAYIFAPYDKVVVDAIKNGDLTKLPTSDIPKYAMCTAATYGQPEVLKYLIGHGASWNDDVVNNIIKYCDLDTLKWAMVNGATLPVLSGNYAAESGNLDTLKWVVKNGG